MPHYPQPQEPSPQDLLARFQELLDSPNVQYYINDLTCFASQYHSVLAGEVTELVIKHINMVSGSC